MTDKDPGSPRDWPKDSPPLTALADKDDELGWDRSRHGKFADLGTADDVVPTTAWKPEDA